MSKVSCELRQEARELGLCDKWYGEWFDNESDESLFDKYKRGIDFCIEREFPDNEYIKNHWDAAKLRANNIFVDDKAELYNPKGTIVVNGASDVCTVFGGFGAAEIYVRHSSKLLVRAKYMSRVMVSIWDDAEVELDCSESAKIYAYVYSDTANVTDKGSVKSMIRKKYR